MAKGKENRETFHIVSVLYCYLGVFYIVGGRTQYHEDPIEGGTTFRRVDMQKFRSIRGAQFKKDRERMKNGGRQKQKCNMGSSALFIGVNNYLSAEFSQLATRCNVRQTKCSAFIAVMNK